MNSYWPLSRPLMRLGTSGTTTITFATQAAQYIRITQTGSANGTFWSIDEFNVFGTAPTVPADPTAAVVSSNAAGLSWNASVSASGYNVKRATVSGGPYTMVASNWNGVNYTDSSLTPGTTYYYIITATNVYVRVCFFIAVVDFICAGAIQ